MAQLFSIFSPGGLAAANDELNKQWKTLYGTDAPIGNAPDQAGDKLAPTSAVVDAMRSRGGPSPLEALMTGFNSSMTVGSKASVGGLDRMAARGLGIDPSTEEQMRKYNAAVHELSPGLHTTGMVVGAIPAAAEVGLSWGLGGVKALGAGAKEVIGPVAQGAQRAMTAGWLSRFLTNAGYGASKVATTAPLGTASAAGITAIGGGLAADRLGLGEYDKLRKAEADPALKGTKWEGMDLPPNVLEGVKALIAHSGTAGLDRNAAAGDGMSAAQQYLMQTRNADGTLAKGITPEMAQLAQTAALFEAQNPGTRVAAPVGMQAAPGGGAMYIPGGQKMAAEWQSGQTPVQAAAAPSAGQAASPVAVAAQAARSLDDTVADYDKLYAAGLMTTKEYNTAKRNTFLTNLAAQLDTTPDVLDALDRSGGLTNKFVTSSLGQRLGPPRTPRIPTASDYAYAARMQEFDQVERDLNNPENGLSAQDRNAQLKALRVERSKFLDAILTKYAYENVLAGQSAGMQVE